MLQPENFSEFSTYLLVNEAERRGIKVRQLFPDKKMSQILMTCKKRNELLMGQRFSIMSAPAYWAARNKDTTKALLEIMGIATPQGFLISRRTINKLNQRLKGLKFPLVAKPRSATHGQMVFINIHSKKELLKAIKKIVRGGKSSCIVEEMYSGGKEYRLFATRKKFLAAANRVPANVVGDGKHTIKELVQLKNSDPRRGKGHSKALVKIKIDPPVKEYLASQKLNLNYVPKNNQQIFLRANSNLSTGGDSIDVTDMVHPKVKKLSIRIVQAIPGLPYAGIDFMTHDITKPPKKGNYIVIELNDSPMLSMHHYPYLGKPRNVAKEIIDLVFPETKVKYRK